MSGRQVLIVCALFCGLASSQHFIRAQAAPAASVSASAGDAPFAADLSLSLGQLLNTTWAGTTGLTQGALEGLFAAGTQLGDLVGGLAADERAALIEKLNTLGQVARKTGTGVAGAASDLADDVNSALDALEAAASSSSSLNELIPKLVELTVSSARQSSADLVADSSLVAGTVIGGALDLANEAAAPVRSALGRLFPRLTARAQ